MKNSEITSKRKLKQTFQKMKNKYPDTLIWIEEGDKYITFNQDALDTSIITGSIVTTQGRSNADYTEFNSVSLDVCLSAAVKAGNRVALVQFLKKPAKI